MSEDMSVNTKLRKQIEEIVYSATLSPGRTYMEATQAIEALIDTATKEARIDELSAFWDIMSSVAWSANGKGKDGTS